MFRAKLSEAYLAVRGGRATLPFVTRPPAPGFRGLPALDPGRCLGCGTCAAACPSRLITVSPGLFEADFGRCVYCARCEEVCPSGAIHMTDRFETAVTDPGALRLRAELPVAVCARCGRDLAVAQSMADHFGSAGRLCPTCKRREWAARLKGGVRRA